eukprot:EC798801.1.p4 GENE.EC798801.1~~EC798801.1.p4  ORF type:complete len:60 (+),score=2.95 EC798801.1:222-401(+)
MCCCMFVCSPYCKFNVHTVLCLLLSARVVQLVHDRVLVSVLVRPRARLFRDDRLHTCHM